MEMWYTEPSMAQQRPAATTWWARFDDTDCPEHGRNPDFLELERRGSRGTNKGDMQLKKYKTGDKVTYAPPWTDYRERGIVKSTSDENHVFVVFHCCGEWGNYMNYTAAQTRIVDLVPGWK
jgi:hypothetical protein